MQTKHFTLDLESRSCLKTPSYGSLCNEWIGSTKGLALRGCLINSQGTLHAGSHWNAGTRCPPNHTQRFAASLQGESCALMFSLESPPWKRLKANRCLAEDCLHIVAVRLLSASRLSDGELRSSANEQTGCGRQRWRFNNTTSPTRIHLRNIWLSLPGGRMGSTLWRHLFPINSKAAFPEQNWAPEKNIPSDL